MDLNPQMTNFLGLVAPLAEEERLEARYPVIEMVIAGLIDA